MLSDDEREWLIEETKILFERAGIERYVAAPLVEPSDRWFPDEWHPDDGGVVRLAKRVFELARVEGIELTATLADEPDERGIVLGGRSESAPLHLGLGGRSESAPLHFGLEGDDPRRFHFVVDPEHLPDPLSLIAWFARLAAHAFRVQSGLVVDDAEHEVELVDLTTIYLGFGLITANAAYRYRASGEIQGNTAITRWSHDEQGTLSANMMAWALGTHLLVRDDPEETRAIANQLEPTQAAVFRAAREQPRDHVVRVLGLPDRATWPARWPAPPQPRTKLPRLWAKQSALPVARVTSTTGLGGRNSGRAVLRMPDNHVGLGVFAGGAVGIVPTIALAVAGHGVAAMGAIAGTFVAGFFVGRRIRWDVCSDPDCNVRLPREVERCPRCGGTIAGRVLRGENRLEAEERLGINTDDYDMDVGDVDPSASVPRAKVVR